MHQIHVRKMASAESQLVNSENHRPLSCKLTVMPSSTSPLTCECRNLMLIQLFGEILSATGLGGRIIPASLESFTLHFHGSYHSETVSMSSTRTHTKIQELVCGSSTSVANIRTYNRCMHRVNWLIDRVLLILVKMYHYFSMFLAIYVFHALATIFMYILSLVSCKSI